MVSDQVSISTASIDKTFCRARRGVHSELGRASEDLSPLKMYPICRNKPTSRWRRACREEAKLAVYRASSMSTSEVIQRTQLERGLKGTGPEERTLLIR